MSKSTHRTPVATDEAQAEVSRLDDRLYRLSVKAARGIKRFRITIISIIVTLLIVLVATWTYDAYEDFQRGRQSARLEALIGSLAPGEDEPEPEAVLGDLDRLLDDVRGAPLERWVSKRTVTFLLDAARERVYADSAAGDDGDTDVDSPTVTPAEAEKSVEPLLARAETIINGTRDRYRDDQDVGRWAEASLDAIRSLRERPAAVESRPQRPVLPPASGGTAETGAGPPDEVGPSIPDAVPADPPAPAADGGEPGGADQK